MLLYIQGIDKIMKTLDSIGIKLFLLAALKENYLYLSLFFCMFTLCSDGVSVLQVVLSNGLYECKAKWQICQIFEVDRLLVCV